MVLPIIVLICKPFTPACERGWQPTNQLNGKANPIPGLSSNLFFINLTQHPQALFCPPNALTLLFTYTHSFNYLIRFFDFLLDDIVHIRARSPFIKILKKTFTYTDQTLFHAHSTSYSIQDSNSPLFRIYIAFLERSIQATSTLYTIQRRAIRLVRNPALTEALDSMNLRGTLFVLFLFYTLQTYYWSE